MKVCRYNLALRQLSGIVFTQAVIGHKTRSHHPRQLAHLRSRFLNPIPPNHQRRQIRIGEVAVIRCIFLGPHRARFAGVRIKQHGCLLNGFAVLNLLNLPAHLVVHGLLHKLEAVQVLDLAARAQRLAGLAHRDIGVAAKAAFLHVAVANTYPGDDLVQFFGVGHRLGGRTHVGLCDDFEQRCTGTVQVNSAHADEVFMQRLARVFFQMRAHQAN